jgi:hypothetical protein
MLARPIALIVALALCFVLSQLPEFAQQYRQRLGGAVDELRRIILQFDEDSLRSGYDRAAALRVMANNTERLVRDQAWRMEDTIARYARLREQEEAFRSAGPLVRLGSFIRNFDPPLVQRTFEAYEPAVPVTSEGLILGGAGFLLGYFTVLIIADGMRKRRRRRRALQRPSSAFR